MGCKYLFDETNVKVWSTPNDWYRYGNVAAIMSFDDTLSRDFKIFKEERKAIPPRISVSCFL